MPLSFEKLDGKFHGEVVRERDGSVVPPDQFVVFLAKDRAFLPTLEFYYGECSRIGCAQPQLNAVLALISRVREWQEANPGQMKLADVEPGEINTAIR